MAVEIRSQPTFAAPQVSDQGYVGQVLTVLINAVKKVWAQMLSLIEGVFHFATCGRCAPLMPPVMDLSQLPQLPEALPVLTTALSEKGRASISFRNQAVLSAVEAGRLDTVRSLASAGQISFRAYDLARTEALRAGRHDIRDALVNFKRGRRRATAIF